jgi:hypothetical protein
MSERAKATFRFQIATLEAVHEYGTQILVDHTTNHTHRTATAEFLEQVRSATAILSVISEPVLLQDELDILSEHRSRIAHLVDLLGNA